MLVNRARAFSGLIVCTAALLLAAAVPAEGATPTVVGKVTGKLPSSKAAATEIRAFELGRAVQVATATVGRTGTFRLALPPGAYALQTTISPGHGGSRAETQRVVPLTLAAGQRRGAVKIAKPSAHVSATGAPAARAAFSQESGAIEPGAVAFSIERFTGATGNLAVLNHGLTDMLYTDLMNIPCRHVMVANSGDRVFIDQEIALSKSKYVDPGSRVIRNFVIPDIVVNGSLHLVGGGKLAYALTLTDGRTHKVLETVSGTLPTDDGLWKGENQMAAKLAKRLCAYGEVFEVSFTGSGLANFALYSATGTLSADTVTAKPTERDAEGATHWEGSAPITWSNIVVSSKNDCSYVDPVAGGSWTAKLARVGDALQVGWLPDAGSNVTVTSVCPDGNGGFDRTPGLVATAVLDSTPNFFLLPSNGMQDVTGPGLDGQGYGWDNTFVMKVKTVRVQPLG